MFGYELPFRTLYELNPMVRFVEMYRDLLYDLRWPAAGRPRLPARRRRRHAARRVGAIFRRLEPRFAEEL